MKRTILGTAVGMAAAWGAWAQAPAAIQPSPAYYRPSASAPVPAVAPAAPAPARVPAQPAPVQPAPVQTAPAVVPAAPRAVPAPSAPAQPVAVRPVPAPQPATALPPQALEAAMEEEDGIYWVWGDKWPGMALGPKFGTTGVGLDYTFGINRHINLRSGFNYGSFNLDKSFGSVKYDTALDMISVPVLVDLYPAGGNFRISAGLYIQPDTKADIDATPGEPEQIGNHVYAPEIIGTLSGTIEVEDVLTPYIGIGFGNTVGEDQWLTFSLDIGVMFQSYDVSLTADGAGMTTPVDTFREDLKKEEQRIQDDADNFQFFPVVTLALGWHF